MLNNRKSVLMLECSFEEPNASGKNRLVQNLRCGTRGLIPSSFSLYGRNPDIWWYALQWSTQNNCYIGEYGALEEVDSAQ